MSISPLTAINAYARNAEVLKNAELGLSQKALQAPSEAQNFGSVFQSFMTDAANALQESERISGVAAKGDADLPSVVLALDRAEIVLTQITAIRDKIVSAYQTVLNSSI